MIRSLMRAAALSVAALAVSTTIASAQPMRNRLEWMDNGVTVSFSVPWTYEECTAQGPAPDSVYTTGIPNTWYLQGQINVGYINLAGNFEITEIIPVAQFGNINIPINYPPFSQITLNHEGIREYHVQPQIEVYYSQGGAKVLWVGGDQINAPGALGPGQAWDVWCRDPGTPPPPPPPPPSLQGCTPGYWKQSQHFDSYPTGVAPSTTFNSIFAGYPLTNVSWLVALNGGGGPGVAGALTILRRAAAAAYLNAALPDGTLGYGLTPAQVVAAVLNAAATGSRDAILLQAAALDARNNQGCPLN